MKKITIVAGILGVLCTVPNSSFGDDRGGFGIPRGLHVGALIPRAEPIGVRIEADQYKSAMVLCVETLVVDYEIDPRDAMAWCYKRLGPMPAGVYLLN